MTQNNHIKKVIFILGIIAVAFSVIIFLLPFSKGGVFWTAYIFELIALIIQIPIFKIAFDDTETMKSKFLGFPVFRIGYIYLFVQTILSIALLIIAGFIDLPVWVALIICTLVLACALICSVTVEAAREEAQRVESNQQASTSNIIELHTISSGLSSLTNDQKLKSELQKLAEAFKYSDPVSSEATAQIESLLRNKLNELGTKLTDGRADISDIRIIINKLTERNEICKSKKNSN